jgi:hypothetical protein
MKYWMTFALGAAFFFGSLLGEQCSCTDGIFKSPLAMPKVRPVVDLRRSPGRLPS